MKIEYFRSKKKTNRFNANQKVWIRLECDNHLYVWFKWRGSGRYVSGVLDKFANCVGEIKEIEVDESFARRVYGKLTPLALDTATPSDNEAALRK